MKIPHFGKRGRRFNKDFLRTTKSLADADTR